MVLACRIVSAVALSTTTSTPAVAVSAGMRQLGNSDLVVSEACLGTMTWGVQNSQSDAHAQLDMARSRGINFIDTAELYPVPLTASTWRAGKTEEILGSYIEKVGKTERDEMIIATKVAGFFPQSSITTERCKALGEVAPEVPADCRLNADSIRRACDASLSRMKTDHIDLYQLHWPDRSLPLFGKTTYRVEDKRDDSIPIRETAEVLKGLLDEGKIRAIGLSNESPYGVGEWVRVCEELGIRDKLASIQNSYSLLDRRFDSDLAESCDYAGIGLLPWSVLAGGLLSGKYQPNAASGPDEKSRFVTYPEYMTRWNPRSASKHTLTAVDDYVSIAAKAGLTPTQLSIEFVRTRTHVNKGSTIVGATTLGQLEENIAVFEKEAVLDDEILAAIDEVHQRCPNPSCTL